MVAAVGLEPTPSGLGNRRASGCAWRRVVATQGFEPRLSGSEPDVLPLNDVAMVAPARIELATTRLEDGRSLLERGNGRPIGTRTQTSRFGGVCALLLRHQPNGGPGGN